MSDFLNDQRDLLAGPARSRDAEVGPWKIYLGILHRRDDPAAVPG